MCVCLCVCLVVSFTYFNPLTPNDPYSWCTAPLTSKCCILYIYLTNIGTEYFKYGIYSPFFFLSSKCSLFHNSNTFGSSFIHILYTGCAKIKKKNHSGAERLSYFLKQITIFLITLQTTILKSPTLHIRNNNMYNA